MKSEENLGNQTGKHLEKMEEMVSQPTIILQKLSK